MSAIQTQPYKKGSKEFNMFAEYYTLIQEFQTPPVVSDDISQAFVDAWWTNAHDKYVAFGEKYGRFANGLAIAALEELQAISEELEKSNLQENVATEPDYDDIFR